jgi:hypothetical protein
LDEDGLRYTERAGKFAASEYGKFGWVLRDTAHYDDVTTSFISQTALLRRGPTT